MGIVRPHFNWLCFSLLAGKLASSHPASVGCRPATCPQPIWTPINFSSRPQTMWPSGWDLIFSWWEGRSAWNGVIMWLLALALPLLFTSPGSSYRDAGFPNSKWQILYIRSRRAPRRKCGFIWEFVQKKVANFFSQNKTTKAWNPMIFIKVIKLIRCHLPPFRKTYFSILEWFWNAKNYLNW